MKKNAKKVKWLHVKKKKTFCINLIFVRTLEFEKKSKTQVAEEKLLLNVWKYK